MTLGLERYYKLVRPDGRDLWGGTVAYGYALRTGELVKHSTYGGAPLDTENDATYFTVATLPSETLGNFLYDSLELTLPYRLFEVEPIGKILPIERFGAHFWRGAKTLRVTQEHPVELVLGANGEAIRSFFGTLRRLAPGDLEQLAAAHTCLSEAEYAELVEATRFTGTFCLAIYLTNLCRAHAVKVEAAIPDVALSTIRDVLVATGWGVATEGAIPARHTDRLMGAWRKVLEGQYA